MKEVKMAFDFEYEDESDSDSNIFKLDLAKSIMKLADRNKDSLK